MKKYFKYVVIFLFVFLIGKHNTFALSISASSTNVKNGSKININVSNGDVLGSYTISSSNTNVLSGGPYSSEFQYPDRSESWSFTAVGPGTATITFTPTKMAALSENGNSYYTQSKSITINVYNPAPVVLSSNNNLASLGVDGKEITPGFSQDTLEYSVEMDPETTKINVTGSVADSSASAIGLGEREVTDGDNRLEIIVTAQNGTTKTYVLNVKVKEYNPIETEIDSKKYTVIRKKTQLTAPPNYTEVTVKMGEEDIHAFHSDITGYTLVGLKDEEGNTALYVYEDDKYTLYKEYEFNKVTLYPMEAPKGTIPSAYKKTTITLNDQKVTAYKIDGASDYALIYGMNVTTGKINLYMYNDEENTLQIYTSEEVDVLAKKVETYTFVIAILSGLSVFLFIVCLILFFHKKKEKDNNKIKVKQVNENKKEKKIEQKLAKEIIENDKFRL